MSAKKKQQIDKSTDDSLVEKGFEYSKNAIFRLMQTKAVKLLGAPGKIIVLAQEAMEKTGKHLTFKELPSFLFHQIQTLFAMLKDVAMRNYKNLETSKVILIITGVLYLVSPIDIVPDFLPFVGLADDIAVITWIISTLSSEMEEYQAWKKKQPVDITTNA